jgi:hypothetical protein
MPNRRCARPAACIKRRSINGDKLAASIVALRLIADNGRDACMAVKKLATGEPIVLDVFCRRPTWRTF